VRLLASQAPGFPERLGRALRDLRPHLVHAFHARKGGAAYLRHALPEDPPLVVTLTGTEVHRDLADPERADEVREALLAARAVLSHGRALLAAAEAAVPAVRGRTLLVPKGVLLPRRRPGYDPRRVARLPRDAFVFLLPAGVREVKDPAFAVEPLARLRAEEPRVAFLHAGEGIEPAAGEALRAALRGRPWARSLGAVPLARMGSLYAAADVVLNTSRAEGLANSLLEAQAAGRPVLASDIPANREAVPPGRTGLLYRAGDAGSFLRAARRLLRDARLRARLGRAGRARAERNFSPDAEADALVAAYRRVVAG